MGMPLLGGFRVILNEAVPVGRAMVLTTDHAIAFHDRYSLFAALFWANVTPRLNLATRACWEEWRATTGAAGAVETGR